MKINLLSREKWVLKKCIPQCDGYSMTMTIATIFDTHFGSVLFRSVNFDLSHVLYK